MMTINNINVYSYDEMNKSELSENELYDLFETPSLQYSLIIEMFKSVNDQRTPEEIIAFCKSDENWVYKSYWKKSDKEKFLEKLIILFKNLYYYSYDKAKSCAQWWLFYYGLSIKDYEKHNKFHKAKRKKYDVK